MLKKYKQQYSNQNIQFVFIDYDGVVIESDQAFLPIGIDDYLYNVHPFFECYSSIKEVPEEEVIFNCVHLHVDDRDFTTDIRMVKKNEGILIVIQDLTTHYIDYQSIAQSRNESIIDGELIVLKNIELEERERFKNTFIQNFSHELRNPLTSIISITDIIGDTPLTEDQRKMVDFLKESNANLKLMLEDILSISMIATGKLQLHLKDFSLPRLLELIEFTYKTKVKQKQLEFSVVSDVKIPEFVFGDRLRLFQILTNLLDNAYKYTETGTIALKVQLNQKRANKVSLRFEVSDTGLGISQENIATVFESFSQLNDPEKQNGTGLGLSIVKGLLGLMDSEIRVVSSIGKGSSFYFDIVLKYPLHPVSKILPKQIDKKSKNKIKLRDNKKYKILLVEDDEGVQTILFKTLMNTECFFIDLVDDGALVMGEIINTTYDLILMDVNLPNVNGDQVAQAIRNFPFKNIKNIPIIGLTANVFEGSSKRYIEMGMNTVLYKPFEKEVLLETIFKFLK